MKAVQLSSDWIAHDNRIWKLDVYDRAVRELKELKIERIDELRMLI